jgi:hypothetical protein
MDCIERVPALGGMYSNNGTAITLCDNFIPIGFKLRIKYFTIQRCTPYTHNCYRIIEKYYIIHTFPTCLYSAFATGITAFRKQKPGG